MGQSRYGRGLRSRRHRGLLAKMAKRSAKKRNRVKGVASRGFFRRRKWIWIVLLVLLLIPVMQVAVLRFVNPPRTLPMLLEQMSSGGTKVTLRYHWIPLSQIPEMFLPRKSFATRFSNHILRGCFTCTC